MTEPEDASRPHTRWLRPGLIALGALVVLGGAYGIARAAGSAPGFCRGGHGAMARDFVEFRVGKALDKVGATDAQKKQIDSILEAQFAQHQALAGQHEEMHRRLVAALGGETVDRAAIEALRAQVVATVDERSKGFAKALGDMADVLTPAQREKFAQLAQERFAKGHIE